MKFHKKRFLNMERHTFVRPRLALFVMFLFSVSLMAQTRPVNGTVKDAHNETLAGMTVKIKGSEQSGTVTDINGRFSITAPASATLVISYVGFNTQSVSASQTSLNVIMEEDTQKLNEVVVIGYGSVKKSDVTGSLSSVSAKEMEKMPS